MNRLWLSYHIAFGVFIREKVDESGTSAPYNASVGSHTLDDGKTNTHRVRQSVSSQDQVGQMERGTQKDGQDNWDEDPRNPRLWPGYRKWGAAAIVITHTDTLSALPGRMIAPGLPEIAHAFGITNSTVAALTLSIFILAYAIGPLFVTPLSEGSLFLSILVKLIPIPSVVYGRSWPLHLSNIFFLVFNLACAWAPDTASLIVFRFFAGIGGSAPLTIGAGSIADLFHERDRAVAMSLFSLGPLMGPIIGPIAGGFITQNVGYPWVFKIISIVAGIATIFGIPLLQETYAPVLNRRRYGYQDSGPSGSLGEVLSENLRRTMLTFADCSMFVTFPTLFASVYGWGPGIAGLAYLGLGIGFMFAAVIGSRLMNTLYLKVCTLIADLSTTFDRLRTSFLKETGVKHCLYCLTYLSINSLSWYGWTAHVKAHYILPIIGSGIFGAGMMFCFMPIQLYLVDSFTYAASAIAAATLFDAMGIGGGHSFLAGIAIVVGVPFPIWIYFKGEQMRARNPLNR
ncbi:multidrug resistance protein 4 [Rhizoctonia solani AG-1 IA]|uniref:Multidrug resistance protein 4 n=1 Tax=Thanatephorus cucumeris (strain AG1-IA) TaxID=983506 RepID=L8WY95_THACA|nr:multidrug resistance protein 4 [Rhizoctonia solani AG-1 IA]